jgi:hypothetical protein
MDLAGQTSSRVAQATLIIAVQVPCERDVALQRLFIRASAQKQLMDEIALDVIDGIIDFGWHDRAAGDRIRSIPARALQSVADGAEEREKHPVEEKVVEVMVENTNVQLAD